MEISKEFQSAYDLVNYTRRNVFLTGKAGTGKTTFLKYLVENSTKRTIVTAPTGVAAINASGVTLHSLFLLPFQAYIPTLQPLDRNIAVNRNDLIKGMKMSATKREVLEEMQLLIIDEISMVRCDTLDAINETLQYVRRNRKPFGGVQLLMIGDLYQLPPIVKNNEWNLLHEHYASPYFFEAKALLEIPLIGLELQTIYRQTNNDFIQILNKLRLGNIAKNDLQTLNTRLLPNFQPKEEGWITLSTHNETVNHINQQNLQNLTEKSYTFFAEIQDTFPEHMFPVEIELTLKVGSQIMFIKNDSSAEKKYFNGKLAQVTAIEEENITVRFLQQKGEEFFILKKETWNHKEYAIDKETGDIDENILGTFSHFPIKLAWAITIHKSQGLTFDKVIIDINRAFASGQAYVALSRCTSLEGIVFMSSLAQNQLQIHDRVLAFHDTFLDADASQTIIETEKYNTAVELLTEILQFTAIQKALQNWITEINKRKIPNQEKTLETCEKCFDTLYESRKIVKKFDEYLQKNKPYSQHNWKNVVQKSSNAIAYFIPIIEDQIIIPFLAHKAQLDKKEKIKLYKKELKNIQLLMLKTREQLYKAMLLETELYTQDKSELITLSETNENPKNTIEKTLELLQEKKTIEEIAEIRGLAISTIQEQICKLVAEEMWNDLEKFISQENIKTLSHYFYEKGTQHKLSDIKNHFEDTFSYFEIKLVLSYYKKQSHAS